MAHPDDYNPSDPQFVEVAPEVLNPDEGTLAVTALPAANLRVQSVMLEAWTSNPNLRANSVMLEAWTIPGNVNERVSSAMLEAWVTNAGSLRVGSVRLEAWVPAPVFQFSLSFTLQPPTLRLHSSRINRSISPFVGPPKFAIGRDTIQGTLPVLPGQMFPITRELIYGVGKQRTASGKLQRTLEQAAPVWVFTLRFEFLRQGLQFLEQQALLGQFLQALGQKGAFLYTDPDDHTTSNVVFANAVYHVAAAPITQTVFQLIRNFYDQSGNVIASMPVYDIGNLTIRTGTNPDGTGGTPTTAFTVLPYGRISFNTSPFILTAPGSNNFLAWSGTFNYLCRFISDSQDFQGLWKDVFQLGELKFKTVKPR